MSAQHTPGPWAFTEGRKDRRDFSSIYKEGDKEFLIAHVICEAVNPHQRIEDIANARLIAAAPDLLVACEAAAGLLRRLGGTNHDPEYSELLQAIAKAKGE